MSRACSGSASFLACAFSGLVGTSTNGAFVESATGIRAGARTGLAAVVTAALFAASLFILPLFEPLQSLRFGSGLDRGGRPDATAGLVLHPLLKILGGR